MKMIKTLSVILSLFLVLLMVPVVFSIDPNVAKDTNGGHLIITNVDAKVDGKSDKDLSDGDEISRDAKPGSKVELTFRVGNNFTDADDEEFDVEIKDVILTVEVNFDYDEVDMESKEFDIKVDDDEKITIDFEVPLEVDEDTFTILISADGDTKKNGSFSVEMELDLVVNKEKNEVIFTKNVLTPSEIKCSKTAQLTSTVINLGEDDEDDVVLEISNTELGVSGRETFDLSGDPDDDDYDVTKTFTFTVPADVQPGIYTIQSRVTYDGGDATETETSELIVTKCEVVEEEPEVECEDDNDCKRNEVCDNGECVEEEVEVVVIPPKEEETTAEEVTTPTLPVTEEESLFGGSGFLVALIAGEVLLVLIAVLLIVAVFKKKG